MANAKLAVAPSPSSDNAPAPKDRISFILLGVVLINAVLSVGTGLLIGKIWGKIQWLDSKTQRIEFEQKEAVKTKAHGKEFVPKELGVLYPLEGFLVNVQSDRGTRFLQMKLELELDTPALEDEIVLKRPALRDAIIMLLSGRTYNELRDSAGIKKLRGDLQRSVNNVLKTGQVKDVYFTQFHFN